MKTLTVAALVFIASSFALGQKTNAAIQKQIKSLKAEKQITLTNDGGASKVMAIAENFSAADEKAAGVQAMNFAMAFFYPGTTLSAPPEMINLTFWPMSKKPQFAGGSRWIVNLPPGPLDLGDSRYTAKPSENMEYLNFKIKRDDLAKIAAAPSVKFKLGGKELSFTPAQMQLLRNIIAISDPK